ncbi:MULTISPECIES: permease [Helicobacter]|uniref:permease n=1 Tax=Helicobacter TaxID=209 RepID=UPI002FE390B2
MISHQILNALQNFVIFFAELSLLFISIDMLVGFLNARYANTIKKHLNLNSSSYLKAIVLGAITPFCSCSTIPFFQALLRNGVHLSVSFAYLLSSPLLNPIILAMLLISFGIALTMAYTIFVVVAVFLLSLALKNCNSTLLLKSEFFQKESAMSCCWAKSTNAPSPIKILKTQNCYTQSPKIHIKSFSTQSQDLKISFKSTLNASLKQYKKLLPYLVVGMFIGVLIHNFIPQGSLESLLQNFDYFGIILAALVGILLYIRVEAIIPIGLGLINAGVPLGAIMSFLIAGGGCSLPELILLKSMFKLRLLFIFVAMVLVIAVGIGFLVVLLGL